MNQERVLSQGGGMVTGVQGFVNQLIDELMADLGIGRYLELRDCWPYQILQGLSRYCWRLLLSEL